MSWWPFGFGRRSAKSAAAKAATVALASEGQKPDAAALPEAATLPEVAAFPEASAVTLPEAVAPAGAPAAAPDAKSVEQNEQKVVKRDEEAEGAKGIEKAERNSAGSGEKQAEEKSDAASVGKPNILLECCVKEGTADGLACEYVRQQLQTKLKENPSAGKKMRVTIAIVFDD